jgi:hypothetical protein
VDGATPSLDETEDVSSSVSAGSSSAAVCGTASSMWVFSWYVGAVSAADVDGSSDGSGMGVKKTPPSLWSSRPNNLSPRYGLLLSSKYTLRSSPRLLCTARSSSPSW